MKRYIKSSKYSDELYGNDMIAELENMEVGTPLLVNSGNGKYIQALYAGVGEIQYRTAFTFFDGSGIAGSFGLSAKYIRENPDTVSIVLNDNDPNKVAELIRQMNSNV
jgi:hypothetical protein